MGSDVEGPSTSSSGPGSTLRQPQRFITDHNEAGQAVFNTTVAEGVPGQVIENGDRFYLAYTTSRTPAELTGGADVAAYATHLAQPPGVVVPGGSVCRIVDVRPGGSSPMHRTISIDYGVVLEGEIDLVLDSGQTRLMRRGDVSVQRGTNHLWRNRSSTSWARMLFVLQEARPVEIGGIRLAEHYGVGMGNVTPSTAASEE